MTDFRAEGTIMGPAGLTAVFGMGTGVAPPVWSPGNRRAVDEDGAAGGSARALAEESSVWWCGGDVEDRGRVGSGSLLAPRRPVVAPASVVFRYAGAAGRGGQAARLLGPVGCDPRGSCTSGLSTWSSPRSLRI